MTLVNRFVKDSLGHHKCRKAEQLMKKSDCLKIQVNLNQLTLYCHVFLSQGPSNLVINPLDVTRD